MPFNQKGRYRARILRAELVIAQNEKQTEQLRLTLQILGKYGDTAQDQAELYEYPEPRFPPEVYLALTETTLGTEANPGWVASTLAHLGFDGDFGKLEQLDEVETDALCQYEIAQAGKRKGQEVERWSILRPITAREAAPPPEKKTVRSLNTRFGKVFRRLAGNTNGKAQEAPKPKPQPAPQPVPESVPEPQPDDSNIPF